MKKVLFASTALVASAGFASAQGIAVTGGAEMGIAGGDGMETQFHTDVEVRFTGSGTTDNGLTFGVIVDLDEAVSAAPASDDGGSSVFISGGFGTLTMGDTDGALDWALTEAAVGNPGSINDAETTHAGYLGAYGDGAYDGQIARYDNTFGDFGFAISAELDDTGVRDNGYAIGFRYSGDLGGVTLGVGIGYQFIDAANFNPGGSAAGLAGDDFDGEYDIVGVSVSATFASGFSAALQYTDFSSGEATDDDQGTHMGIGFGYASGPFSVHANYGVFDIDHDAAADEEITGFGLAAGYDLGGGASLLAGYSSGDSDIDGDLGDLWSIGLSFSF